MNVVHEFVDRLLEFIVPDDLMARFSDDRCTTTVHDRGDVYITCRSRNGNKNRDWHENCRHRRSSSRAAIREIHRLHTTKTRALHWAPMRWRHDACLYHWQFTWHELASPLVNEPEAGLIFCSLWSIVIWNTKNKTKDSTTRAYFVRILARGYYNLCPSGCCKVVKEL